MRGLHLVSEKNRYELRSKAKSYDTLSSINVLQLAENELASLNSAQLGYCLLGLSKMHYSNTVLLKDDVDKLLSDDASKIDFWCKYGFLYDEEDVDFVSDEDFNLDSSELYPESESSTDVSHVPQSNELILYKNPSPDISTATLARYMNRIFTNTELFSNMRSPNILASDLQYLLRNVYSFYNPSETSNNLTVTAEQLEFLSNIFSGLRTSSNSNIRNIFAGIIEGNKIEAANNVPQHESDVDEDDNDGGDDNISSYNDDFNMDDAGFDNYDINQPDDPLFTLGEKRRNEDVSETSIDFQSLPENIEDLELSFIDIDEDFQRLPQDPTSPPNPKRQDTKETSNSLIPFNVRGIARVSESAPKDSLDIRSDKPEYKLNLEEPTYGSDNDNFDGDNLNEDYEYTDDHSVAKTVISLEIHSSHSNTDESIHRDITESSENKTTSPVNASSSARFRGPVVRSTRGILDRVVTIIPNHNSAVIHGSITSRRRSTNHSEETELDQEEPNERTSFGEELMEIEANSDIKDKYKSLTFDYQIRNYLKSRSSSIEKKLDKGSLNGDIVEVAQQAWNDYELANCMINQFEQDNLNTVDENLSDEHEFIESEITGSQNFVEEDNRQREYYVEEDEGHYHENEEHEHDSDNERIKSTFEKRHFENGIDNDFYTVDEPSSDINIVKPNHEAYPTATKLIGFRPARLLLPPPLSRDTPDSSHNADNMMLQDQEPFSDNQFDYVNDCEFDYVDETQKQNSSEREALIGNISANVSEDDRVEYNRNNKPANISEGSTCSKEPDADVQHTTKARSGIADRKDTTGEHASGEHLLKDVKRVDAVPLMSSERYDYEIFLDEITDEDKEHFTDTESTLESLNQFPLSNSHHSETLKFFGSSFGSDIPSSNVSYKVDASSNSDSASTLSSVHVDNYHESKLKKQWKEPMGRLSASKMDTDELPPEEWPHIAENERDSLNVLAEIPGSQSMNHFRRQVMGILEEGDVLPINDLYLFCCEIRQKTINFGEFLYNILLMANELYLFIQQKSNISIPNPTIWVKQCTSYDFVNSPRLPPSSIDNVSSSSEICLDPDTDTEIDRSCETSSVSSRYDSLPMESSSDNYIDNGGSGKLENGKVLEADTGSINVLTFLKPNTVSRELNAKVVPDTTIDPPNLTVGSPVVFNNDEKQLTTNSQESESLFVSNDEHFETSSID